MKILRIYSLEGKGLSDTDCQEIKKQTNTDVLIHMTANNQLEHTQYPVFEFDEIEGKTESCLKVEINRDEVKKIIKRQFSERNTSIL